MAAEVLIGSGENDLLKYYDPWKRVLLHDSFAEKNIRESIKAKAGLDVSKPHIKKIVECNRNEQIKQLEEFAARKLMKADHISSFKFSNEMPDDKFGLVVDNGDSVDFEHDTLADFFLGRWLFRNWKELPKKKDDLFQRGGFQLSAATFSWFLFKDLPLHRAVARGDEDAVRHQLLVTAGTADGGGRTALHVAAMTRGKGVKVLKLLLDSGVDPNEKDAVLGWTAAQYAETFRNWEFVDELTENGKLVEGLKIFSDRHAAIVALREVVSQNLVNLLMTIYKKHIGIIHQPFCSSTNMVHLHIAAIFNATGILKRFPEMLPYVNVQDINGITPLYLATHNGHKEAVQLLLEKGADPNLKTGYWDNALMSACRQGHLEIVDLLTDNGEYMNARDMFDYSALDIAARQGNVEMLELLMKKGADPNIGDAFGQTPLMTAAYEGRLEAVKLLIDKGKVDPNTRSVTGITALMLAALQGHLEVLKLLIEKGADVNTTAQAENTAFMQTAEGGYLDDEGTHPNSTNSAGYTALMIAARKGFLDVVKVLTEKGVEPRVRSESGDTALILAASEGHLDIVQLLMEKGEDANAKNKSGDTALSLAAQRGHLSVVKLLLEKGADMNVGNETGGTALMLAAGQGNLDVLELLTEKGADPGTVDNFGNTAFMMAADRGHLESLKLLMATGADPNLKNKDGNTALMVAARQGQLQAVELLLRLGADPNLTNADGNTAIKMAFRHGHLGVIDLLIKREEQTRAR